MSRVGADYLTTVPNWPKLQGFDCTKRAEQSKAKHIEREPAASPPPDPEQSPQKPQGITRQSPQKTKHATQCPEDLTPEQWGQVHTWRDKKHPEFDDFILKSEWEKHALHFGALGTARTDWVRSFYGWLLRSKDFSKSKGGTDPPRPTPPVREREPRPPAWTQDELEEARVLGEARRKKGRARHAKAPAEEEVEDVPF
jgi:hypothetical protein